MYYLLLAGILTSSKLSYFRPLDIPLWFGLQVMFPVSFISVIFFVGPPPLNFRQLQYKRHKIHAVFAFIAGLLTTGATISFMAVQLIYVASLSCATDPDSICNGPGRKAVFVALMTMCSVLALLSVMSIVTVFASWLPHKKKSTDEQVTK